jgi:ABC-type transport system involved in multi-copper enzyme maturation permease subunit
MNPNIARALFSDALSQVVDNRVFRILFVILCALVLPTFVIGARPEHLTVLFMWDYSYDEVFGLFGGMVSSTPEPNRLLIQSTQKVLTDGFAGSFGILFAIAATAFFVPRMLEKGAADVVFSKPVSRFALLMTRYVAGLVFTAVLATAMVGGMHLGFLLVSGWSDPGFLWSITILIYVFAVVHAVSCLVGVFTRSSVAAMLVTLVFYSFNGCVHNAWHGTELARGQASAVSARGDADVEEETDHEGPPHGPFLDTLMLTLDAAHYVLPKTTEADFIAKRVRTRLERRNFEFWDEQTDLFIAEPPKGFTREADTNVDTGGIVWSDTEQPAAARIVFARKPITETGSRMAASKKFETELESDSRASDVTREVDHLRNTRSQLVKWLRRDEGTNGRRHVRWYFENDRWLYTLDIEADVDWVADADRYERAERFRWKITFNEADSGVAIQVGTSIGLAMGLDKRYGWTAPVKYNYFFSILSTLAFIVAVLAFAQWKLKRIDF